MKDDSQISRGTLLLAEIDPATYEPNAAMLSVGNADVVDIASTATEVSIKGFNGCSSADVNTYDASRVLTIATSLIDINARNLSIALKSVFGSNVSAPIVDESHIAYAGGFIPLDFMPDVATIIVQDEADAITYVEGVDYTVSPAGISMVDPMPTIVEGDVLHIGYTSIDASVIEPLTNISVEYRAYFEGVNCAQSDSKYNILFYRFKPEMSELLSLINVDDFGRLPLTGKILANPKITDPTKSQYYSMQKVLAQT